MARGIQAAWHSIRNAKTTLPNFHFRYIGWHRPMVEIPFDLSQPPVTYAEQALAVVRRLRSSSSLVGRRASS